MIENKEVLHLDEHGVYRIGTTRVMLDSVVAAFQQGFSPESIRQQYPALTLQEVYGTISQYLANREEFDAYLRRQAQVWQEARIRADQRPSEVFERLKGLRKAACETEAK